MALLAVKGTIDRVLDKNLQDLVRGIRNHRNDETKYINECIEEIKIDLKQGSVAIKANAVAKLVYLQMLGCDVNWAVFNIVEVMSSQRFTHKRIGYLAASQSFHQGTDVLMLTTNQIRKDLTSLNTYDSGVSISGLSCFITPDLAMNLYNEILSLTTSAKPYLRKKSVLLLYKVFLNHPEALRICFPRLKERLEDSDLGVQCAAVNVICELARKNPGNYLSLAPVFFNMMKNSTNNWVLIKIIKLFGALTPLEPRLGKKLIEPLTNLIHSTSAMSLLYECINTVVAVLISISSGVPDHQAAIQLCVQKLRVLIEDSDQNLKYLGLLAMDKILHFHTKSLQPHKDIILACLHDKDESIRLRALSLLHGMVTQRTLVEIVQCIIGQIDQMAASTHYRNELVAKIIHICSQEDYRYVTSFEWYISILVEIARMDGVRDGALLADQLIEVAIRVPSVRSFCVDQMAILFDLWSPLALTGANQSAFRRVMESAAWICGEYANHLKDARNTLNAILKAANCIPNLPNHVQALFLSNAFKLYCAIVKHWACESHCQVVSSQNTALPVLGGDTTRHDQVAVVIESLGERLLELSDNMLQQFTLFMHSPDLEVQERAVSLHKLCSLVIKRLKKLLPMITDKQMTPKTSSEPDHGARNTHLDVRAKPAYHSKAATSILDLADELAGLFVGEINRVAPKAQRKVPIPHGLDLDVWINPPPSMRSTTVRGEMRLTSMLVPRPADSLGSAGASFAYGTKSLSNPSTVSHSDPIFPELPSTAAIPKVVISQSELDEMREKRLQQQQSNPHYLKPSTLNSTGKDVTSSAASATHSPPPTSDSSATPANNHAVRECAKSEQFARQIQEQFLQLDIQKNMIRSRKLHKSKRKLSRAKEDDNEVSPPNMVPAVFVRASYDEPEVLDPNNYADDSSSGPELNRHLDLERGVLTSPHPHTKSPQQPEGNAKINSIDRNDTLIPKVQFGHKCQVNGNSASLTSGPRIRRSDNIRLKDTSLSSEDYCLVDNNNHTLVTEVTTTLVHKKPLPEKTVRSTSADTLFIAVSISVDEFTQLLMTQGQQSLSCKQSGKFHWLGSDAAFLQLISTLSEELPCTVVQVAGHGAVSLYVVYGVQRDPVCCLLKRSPTGFLHFSVKSVNQDAISAFADRMKTLVQEVQGR